MLDMEVLITVEVFVAQRTLPVICRNLPTLHTERFRQAERGDAWAWPRDLMAPHRCLLHAALALALPFGCERAVFYDRTLGAVLTGCFESLPSGEQASVIPVYTELVCAPARHIGRLRVTT